MNNIKEILDQHVDPSLKFDQKLVQMLTSLNQKFQRKDATHINFFSSAYFGLDIIKWTSRDDDYWFDKILKLDEDEVADLIWKLPTVNKDHAVSSNILSISMLYMMHRFEVSSLPDRYKNEGKIVLMEILLCRYLSSIMNNYFSLGPTSADIAQEVLNRLSNRFDIKRLGSWSKFIRHRAETLTIGEHERNAKFSKQEVFLTFDDEQVVRKLNAIKTSLNAAIKEINAEFRVVLNDRETISTSSSLASGIDGLYVKDLLSKQGEYISYQTRIFADKSSFLREDLIEVIESSMPTISSNLFRGALEWIVDNQDNKKYKKDITSLRTDILLYGLELMQEESIGETDMMTLAHRIRQNFMSGRASDPALVKCRKIADKLIIAYRPKSAGKVITLERVSIMMYFVLRTMMLQSQK